MFGGLNEDCGCLVVDVMQTGYQYGSVRVLKVSLRDAAEAKASRKEQATSSYTCLIDRNRSTIGMTSVCGDEGNRNGKCG